jgi:hypothetical protein
MVQHKRTGIDMKEKGSCHEQARSYVKYDEKIKRHVESEGISLRKRRYTIKTEETKQNKTE